jgi:hypothetical protein
MKNTTILLLVGGAAAIYYYLMNRPAAKAQRIAVQRAVKSKTATKEQAKAVVKELAKGIRFSGYNNNDVLV